MPNLDSIAEFKIITSNAGAEYGNYSGGLVNVVTKSGTNSFHGNAFEFVRNTSLDAKNYFSAPSEPVGVYHQNQFGGPILRNKLFFFVDYQGTRQIIGTSTRQILVPSAAERTGDFSDLADQFAGKTVNGGYWAGVLSSRLGYTVTQGEDYYTPGCTSSAVCVFPNAVLGCLYRFRHQMTVRCAAVHQSARSAVRPTSQTLPPEKFLQTETRAIASLISILHCSARSRWGPRHLSA